MIFPRLLFQQGHFTGVAISNPTATDALINLSVYNPDGSLYAGAGVTNPSAATIRAGSQWAKVAAEILFAAPPASVVDSPAPTTVWLEVTSPVDGLTGFFLDGSQTFDILDGADLTGSGGHLVLPVIEVSPDARTEVSIVNTDGNGSADATIELLDANGIVVRTHSVSIQSRNGLQGSVDSLFPGSYDRVRTMRIRSSQPLAAAAFIIRRTEDSLVVLGAQRGDLPSGGLYFPQMVQGDGWSTTVGIVNLISSPVLVTLTAHQADGTLFAPPALQNNPVTVNLPSGGLLRSDAQTLFGFAATPPQSGWLKAEASEPAIAGYVEYGTSTNRALMVAKPAPVTRAIYSQQANGAGYYTGLAVLNTTSSVANVEVVSMSSDGKALGKTKRVIRPLQREAVLIDQWIPAVAGVVGGSILLKSDTPVITTQLFGTTSFTALCNVPPQDVPPSFDPGGAASLKVAPPLAVVETGKSLKLTATGPAIGRWAVNGVVGGYTAAGLVSSAGTYTAPAIAPRQHTQAVQAATAAGDQTGASSVDVVQREVLTSALTQLTAVAYFQSLQRFFVAEQQLLSAAKTGLRQQLTVPNTRISEVSSSGATTEFFQLTNDAAAKMLPFTDGKGAEHLLLAGRDSGKIYKLSLSTKDLVTVATGFAQPSSMALDPISGDLYVAESGGGQVTMVPRSKLESGSVALSATRAVRTEPSRLVVASPRGIAFDPCTGALYATTSDGTLREYLNSREREIVTGLDNPGQILVLLRKGVPTCSDAVTVFVAENTRVAQIHPRQNQIISFLDATQEVEDLSFFNAGSPFIRDGEEAIIVAEGPLGEGLSRVLYVPVGGLYQTDVEYGSLSSRTEYYPGVGPGGSGGVSGFGESIAFLDPLGDTFATALSEEAGLAVPDIVAVNVTRIGDQNVVTLTFADPVAPASRFARTSIRGYIDFDLQEGTGISSHPDPHRGFRRVSPDTDAYIDLGTGILYRVTAISSDGTPTTTQSQLLLSFLDSTMSVTIPRSIFDAQNARVNVTIANAAETADIAPDYDYAFDISPPSPYPTVQFAKTASEGTESATTLAMDVVMSSAFDQPASVSYGIIGGTAAGGGVDYWLPGDTLTFAPGETIRTISLAVVNDTTAEPDKTVVVSLLGASNAVLGANTSYTYTIRGELGPPLPGTEGPPLVQFEMAASRESESGTSLKRVAVTLTHAAAGKVTVAYSVAGGTASEADYAFTPGVLNFYPGETRKTFSFSLADDTISESAETVVFTLSKVSSNAKLGAPSQYTYTIADDDGLPRVQFEIAASGGPESNISPAPIAVTLTNPSAATVTVDYAVAGGTADATDYSFAPGTLVFNPGETSKTFVFSVVDDTNCEPDETIIFSLSNMSSSVLPGTQSNYTYTIIADDPVPTAQFDSAASNNPESVPQVHVPVSFSNPSATAVAVTYLAARNTTTVGVVEVVGSGTVTFAPGEILRNMVFPIVVETTPEANETVYIPLTGASGAVLGAITTHTYYFVEDL